MIIEIDRETFEEFEKGRNPAIFKPIDIVVLKCGEKQITREVQRAKVVSQCDADFKLALICVRPK